MNYGIVVALAALFPLATAHARAVALPTPTPTPTPTPVSAVKQSVATANPTPAATPTPLSTVKQSGAVVTAAPAPPKALQTTAPATNQKAPPGVSKTTAPAGVAPRPAPTPAFVSPSAGSAMVGNTPAYSPSQLDFGEVWDGDMTRKTLRLTTTAAGYVTVQIPKGPFRVAEFREMGAAQLPSKNNPANKSTANVVPIQPVKNRITYLDGQSGPFQWSMAPGVDIQIDIAFQPHFNLMSEIAGQKSATMKVTGPGPKLDWAFAVPLRGMFDGLKLTAQIVPDPRELYAVTGDPNTWIKVRVIGLDRSVTGTLRGEGTLPPGISVVPTQVTVPAKQTVAAVLPINYGTFPGDMVPRTIHLVFDDGSQKSTAQIQFTALPRSVQLDSGPRVDCGIAKAELTITLWAPDPVRSIDDHGQPTRVAQPHSTLLDFEFRGRNLDLIDRRRVWIDAEVDGVGIFADGFTLYEHDATETIVKKSNRLSASLDYEAWARLLGGQAQFGCQLSEQGSSPKVLNLKWAPGDLHVP